jgi:hypothetical protein
MSNVKVSGTYRAQSSLKAQNWSYLQHLRYLQKKTAYKNQ